MHSLRPFCSGVLIDPLGSFVLHWGRIPYLLWHRAALLPLWRGGVPRPERGEAGEELVAFHLKKLLGLGEPSQAMAAEAAEAEAGW